MLAFLIAFVFTGSLAAVGQSLSTTIDKKDILIGEPIHYQLKFIIPANGYKAQFVIPDSLSHFEIIETKSTDTAEGNTRTLLQKLKLTSWDSGKWYIPKIPVKVVPPGANAPYTAYTDEIEVNVGYMPIDSTGKPRDIKQVMDVKYVDNKWYYIAAAVLLALLIAYLIYRYFKNRKNKPKPIFESSLTPYDEALKEMDKLKTLQLNDPGEVKQFHSSLSDIFRRYFSRKQQKNYMTETTGEILLSMKSSGSSTETIATLAEALRYSDVVKFAKFLPPREGSLKSLENMKQAIELIEKQPSKEKTV